MRPAAFQLEERRVDRLWFDRACSCVAQSICRPSPDGRIPRSRYPAACPGCQRPRHGTIGPSIAAAAVNSPVAPPNCSSRNVPKRASGVPTLTGCINSFRCRNMPFPFDGLRAVRIDGDETRSQALGSVRQFPPCAVSFALTASQSPSSVGVNFAVSTCASNATARRRRVAIVMGYMSISISDGREGSEDTVDFWPPVASTRVRRIQWRKTSRSASSNSATRPMRRSRR